MSDAKPTMPDRVDADEADRTLVDTSDVSDAEFHSEDSRTDESGNERDYASHGGKENHEETPVASRRAELRRLMKLGLKEVIAQHVVRLFERGALYPDVVDLPLIRALNGASLETSFRVLQKVESAEFFRVDDKSGYLRRLIMGSSGVLDAKNDGRSHEYGNSRRRAAGNYNDSYGMIVLPPERVISDTSIIRMNGRGPDGKKMQQIFAATPFILAVSVGQRKYTVPDKTQSPAEGNEVFICKIPREVYEDELIPLLQSCGDIHQLRFMIDPVSGYTRGYAFCKFRTQDGADKAVRELDELEVRPGRKLGASVSFSNQRLFVSNIPKNKDKDELHEEFAKHAPGLVEVIIYSSPDDRKKNRGFCFLEYENHRAAGMAKRKLGSGRFKIWNCDIIVDWADPLEQPDDEVMSKVKVLYVRNLTQKVTEDDLKKAFQAYGVVERVKKLKDYAFVHFTDREKASKALRELNGTELGDAPIEVTWAKPPSDKRKKEEILRKREVRMTHLMYNRGKFWSSNNYGNSNCGVVRAANRSPAMGRSGVNGPMDFSNQKGLHSNMARDYLGYAAATAAAAAAAAAVTGGPPDMFGLGMPPMAGPEARQQQEMSYNNMVNAADFWDDFNELDMNCSPLAPAAVPIPASAAANMTPPPGLGHGNHGGLPPQPYGDYAHFVQEFGYASSGAAAVAAAAAAAAAAGAPPPPLLGPPMGPMAGMAMPGGIPPMPPQFMNAPGPYRTRASPGQSMMGQVPMGMSMAPGSPRQPYFSTMDGNRGGPGPGPNDGYNQVGNNNPTGGGPGMFYNNGGNNHHFGGNNNGGGNNHHYGDNNNGGNTHHFGDDGHGHGSPTLAGLPGQSPHYYQ